MASGWSSARGQLIWSDEERRRSAGPDVGRAAELQASVRLAEHGWQIGVPANGADIVALDPKSHGQIRLEVKAARPLKKGGHLFVTDPRAPVDAHIFVAVDEVGMGSLFWIVPDQVVKAHAPAGVLQESDVEQYLDAWQLLREQLGV